MRRHLIPTSGFSIRLLARCRRLFRHSDRGLRSGRSIAYLSGQSRIGRSDLITFGLQAALYSIPRFRLFLPTSGHHTGTLMGASEGTSTAATVACCLHHITDVWPALGMSAAATFLTRYPRPFMRLGLAMNTLGILIMLIVLYRQYQNIQIQH